jgi:hypothetical protein
MGISAATTKAAVSGISEMNFLSGHLTDAQYNDLAAYIASTAGGTPTYLTVTATPLATLSTTSIAFGSVTVGNTSTTRTITLTNAGTAALTIGTIASNHSAFTLTHNCPATLAVSSSCTLSFTFTPAAATAYNSSATVTTNAASGTQTISLSGAGTAAATGLLSWSGSPTALTFAAAPVGSVSATQTLTLQNQGTAAASLSAVALSGTDAGDFTTSGTCSAGANLAANASCTVIVQFEPTAIGSRSATLQVTASNAGNPASIALSGTATAASTPSSGTGAATGTTSTSSAANSNEGGGGCSMARPGGRFDPVLIVLAALAAAVLWWRRCEGRTP